MIVVTGDGRGASSDTLQRYERDGPGADWRVVRGAEKVSLGQRGFAWGIGLDDRGGLRAAGLKLASFLGKLRFVDWRRSRRTRLVRRSLAQAESSRYQ